MARTFKISVGDIFYDVKGQPAFTASDNDKISQDLAECTLVPTDDIGFGMGISDLVGSVQDPGAIPSLLENFISDGITRMISLQQSNQRLTRSDSELIGSIASIQAGPNAPNNFTDFAFSYAVNTIAGDRIAKKGTFA